jgi:peptidoglycan biosynthesis protein MviN/MurJ (putative lipid II flippase)
MDIHSYKPNSTIEISLTLVFTIIIILIITLPSVNSLAWAEETTIHVVYTRDHFDEFGNLKPNRSSYEPFPLTLRV